jgi:hypothetical protein
MADVEKSDLELEIEGGRVVEDPSSKRFKELSAKASEALSQRDLAANEKKAAEDRAAAAEKDRDFFMSFSDMVSKYPNAKDHREDIRTKYLSGYDIEDATISTLAKNGKLSTDDETRHNVAGGSAATTMTDSSDGKSTKNLSTQEKWSALREAEQRGEIGMR